MALFSSFFSSSSSIQESKETESTPSDFFEAGANGDWPFLVRNRFSDFNAINKDNRSVLYLAARAGHLKVVLYCLNNGADVNWQEKLARSTPLHAAAYYGHGKVVQAIMGYAPDTSIRNRYGLTAAQEARDAQIRSLIERPKRLCGSNRFFVKREEVPQFCVDTAELRVQNVSWVPSGGTSRTWRLRVISRLSGLKNMQFAVNFLKKYVDSSATTWHEKIVNLYTQETPLHRTMNNDLNGLDKLTECKEYAGSLRLALRTVGDDFRGTVYRSAVIDEKDMSVYRARIGSCVKWLQFSSCTKSKAVALGWGGNVLFKILPVGSSGLMGLVDMSSGCGHRKDVSRLSNFPAEEEVLYEDGSLFYVRAVSTLTGQKTHRYQITVQEVTSAR